MPRADRAASAARVRDAVATEDGIPNTEYRIREYRIRNTGTRRGAGMRPALRRAATSRHTPRQSPSVAAWALLYSRQWASPRSTSGRPQRELRGRQAAVPRAADRDPLRPPRDARRAGHRVGRRGHGPSAQALDGIDPAAHRRAPLYDGSDEDLFFYVERLIADACGDDVAGRLHTARSRNDIDMTMYRMRQREALLGLDGGDARAAAGAPRRWPSAHRDTRLRRAHAHAAGAAHRRSRTTCWPSSSSSSATPCGSRRPTRSTNRNPLGACAITGTGFPIDRRLHQRRCSGSTARPATPTAASPRSTTCSRASRRRPCMLVGLGRVAAGPAALVHGGVRLPAARRRLRAGQQHHAAEAQPGRARARARDRQQGARPGAGGRAAPCTTRRSATSSTPRTTCSRSSLAMFRDATRAVRLVAAAMRGAELRRRAHGGARGRGRDHADRAGRHAGARARAVRSATAHAIAARLSRPSGSADPDAGARRGAGRRPRASVTGTPIEITDERLREVLSPGTSSTSGSRSGGPAPERDHTGAGRGRGGDRSRRRMAAGRRAALAAAAARLRRKERAAVSAPADRSNDRTWAATGPDCTLGALATEVAVIVAALALRTVLRRVTRRDGPAAGRFPWIHAHSRLARRRGLPRLDRLRRPEAHEGERPGRGLLPRQPQPAVVGRRPVGDGHAAERHHAGRHDGAGLRRRPALRAVLLRAAARDGHPVGDAGAVLPPGEGLHGLRVPRAAVRREDAHAHEPAVPGLARHVVRRRSSRRRPWSCRSSSAGTSR